MGRIARQTVLPACVVLLGVAALVYGACFRSITVWEEKEREITVAVPAPFGADPWGGDLQPAAPASESSQSPGTPAGDEVDPFGNAASGASTPGGEENPFEAADNTPSPPLGMPPMRFQKINEPYEDEQLEPESVIVREVTFGGVVRLANGQLKRTYSGQPPALCPT